ncbi:hypothetical protein IC762_17225 [Bradyrhizobium genosp. L]|uniref:hypothetical protein n=1 Tax=Bradyrhizobium genosp. L TaxID=83637 RepID=UPI0018A30D24|nr:hypothetical protein [Bradyrhizobium genosp. L]QPF81576.1 hypothetical protein IC762_17225 [Bradyrhizobium genosp. L]
MREVFGSFFSDCRDEFMLRTGLILFAILAGLVALLSLPDTGDQASAGSAIGTPVSQLDR